MVAMAVVVVGAVSVRWNLADNDAFALAAQPENSLDVAVLGVLIPNNSKRRKLHLEDTVFHGISIGSGRASWSTFPTSPKRIKCRAHNALVLIHINHNIILRSIFKAL